MEQNYLSSLLNFSQPTAGGYNMMNNPMMGGNGQGNNPLANLNLNNNNGGGGEGGSLQTLFGNPQNGSQGMLMPAVQSLSGLASTYLGMKQYGMAKDAFKESKRQFNLNFDAQKKSYNNQLSDRQRARRISAGEGADNYQSEAEYMKKWSI